MRCRRSLIAIVLLTVGACTADVRPAQGPEGIADGDLAGTIVVSAASSLTEPFTVIAEAFEDEHPSVTVELNFASSTTLANQIDEGAPVDVFASADVAHLAAIADAGDLDGEPVVFATNRLAIATKPGNPEHIGGLDDLTRLDVVALCVATAPCGRLADHALARAGVTLDDGDVTRGQNAKATLGAVADGDAQAAVVYLTDALAATGLVDTVDLPDRHDVTAEYAIAVIGGTGDSAVARAFVAHVRSDSGRSVLTAAGFGPPR